MEDRTAEGALLETMRRSVECLEKLRSPFAKPLRRILWGQLREAAADAIWWLRERIYEHSIPFLERAEEPAPIEVAVLNFDLGRSWRLRAEPDRVAEESEGFPVVFIRKDKTYYLRRMTAFPPQVVEARLKPVTGGIWGEAHVEDVVGERVICQRRHFVSPGEHPAVERVFHGVGGVWYEET